LFPYVAWWRKAEPIGQGELAVGPTSIRLMPGPAFRRHATHWATKLYTTNKYEVQTPRLIFGNIQAAFRPVVRFRLGAAILRVRSPRDSGDRWQAALSFWIADYLTAEMPMPEMLAAAKSPNKTPQDVNSHELAMREPM
jgi:hypothetical protein